MTAPQCECEVCQELREIRAVTGSARESLTEAGHNLDAAMRELAAAIAAALQPLIEALKPLFRKDPQ